MQNFKALAQAVWFPHDFQIWQDFPQKHHFLVIFYVKTVLNSWKLNKNDQIGQEYSLIHQFFSFFKIFHNRKNLSKHFSIFEFKICLYLPSNFFIQIGVVAKPFEPVLWNFAWQNGRSCAFRRNKAEFFNINTLCTIKVSFVTVVTDGRVCKSIRQKYNLKSHSAFSPVSINLDQFLTSFLTSLARLHKQSPRNC